MRKLEQSLHDHELITLRVMGEWWELDLAGADKTACVRALVERLGGLEMQYELNFLAPEEAAALEDLVRAGGRIPVAAFSREHGEVRLMGPGRLEREEPWFDPVSPAESLWYRGFLYRGFDETEEGVVEFYYLPDELLTSFPSAGKERAGEQDSGALEPAEPPLQYDAAPTTAVDDVTTLLIFAQRGELPEEQLSELAVYLQDAHPTRCALMLELALEQNLLRRLPEGVRPSRPAVDWLQQGREAQLRSLAQTWRGSDWNELCHTPGLLCEGSGWENDPLLARRTLIEWMPRDGNWYRIGDLVAEIKRMEPDFQRPDANYDTWYIRDTASDAYITGFSNWDLVEGRLLRFLIEGPLFWLGMIETGEGMYRLTDRGLGWLAGHAPDGAGVTVPLVVQADATLLVPHNADRYQRFQAARIADPEPLTPNRPYGFQITPTALERARTEGITPERVLQFLEQASGRPLPTSVRRSVERWSENGLEARIGPVVLLRVREAEILDKLVANPKTQPYLGERLGDLAVIVHRDNWRTLQQLTAQLGLLIEVVE